jgi:CheY-like chemotaxis protein/anti-sigma regulatory factor (Ser/Thr protein kinase)
VLDLSRFDSGKIELDESEFDLQEVIRAESAQYQTLAKAAGLTLTAVCGQESIWLKTDRMKLARVLGNLIGNAIKFTEVGTVTVQCASTASRGVEIRVSDTGVGIHQDHLSHIFDEFYQINNPERDRSKGTGLGLAICKRLTDAIGCSLSVQSGVGQGTTFAIGVPRALVSGGPGSRRLTFASDDQKPNPLAGVRVLVVEDHELTRNAVAKLLAAQGATVDQAWDGRAALHTLRHHSPDVVLLDLMLPDMDGREILQHLLSNRPQNLRCLLAVSGDVTEARQEEIERLGADGLVAKPVQIETLTARICEQLQTRTPHDGPAPRGHRSTPRQMSP